MSFVDLLNWITGRPVAAPTPAPAAPQADRRAFARLDFSRGEVDLQGIGGFPLVNLGYGGLSLKTLDHPILAAPQAGLTLPARVRLGTVFFEAQLKVCSATPGMIHCSFLTLGQNHSRIIAEFVKPRLLGLSLREIDASAMKETEGGQRQRWFQGDEGSQIFLWSSPEGVMQRVEFYFLDYVIAFDLPRNLLRTGVVRTQGVGWRPDQQAMKFHQAPSFRALNLGRIILDHARLPEEVKQFLQGPLLREEKCSFNRVILGERENQVVFHLEEESGPVTLRVVNLCLHSIAFLRPDAWAGREFPEGREWSGRLHLPGSEVPATIRLVHQQEFVMGGGLRFQRPEDAEVMSAFLSVRLLGASLEKALPPTESKPFAPETAQPTLFLGIHNTHILSLVTPPNRLYFGRLAFMDRVLVWERNVLTIAACPRGIIFPADWDVPSHNLEKVADEAAVLVTVREILKSACLPKEILLAWESVLPPKTA